MGIKRIIIFITVILISIPFYSEADAGRVLKSTVSPEKGSVGQNFVYTVSLAGRDLGSIKITLPDKGGFFPDGPGKDSSEDNAKSEDENAVPLYIINSSTKEDSESEGMKQISVTVNLTYYRTGVHQLPEINIIDSDGVKLGYSIPSVTIEEINKEGKPEDIEPPIDLSGNYTRLIVIILAAIVIVIAGIFIFRLIKKRRKAAIIPEIKESPIEFFKNEIERLKLREAADEGRVNDYVFGMSITFRRFLSMELGFDAAEMTTGEISALLKKYLQSSAGFAGEIVSIMEIWDLSKFAEFTLKRDILILNFENIVKVAGKIPDMKRGIYG